jgi:leader peptidase (prepilin peptidase)/N-methyltransferase
MFSELELFLARFVYVLEFYPALALAGAVLIGLIFGSFVNVVAYRLPRLSPTDGPGGEDSETAMPHSMGIVRPRSFCPQCARPLTWHENIPLLSYVVLKGRCAGCSAAISWRYPIVEALCALGCVGLVWSFGIDARTLPAMAFLLALICISVIDLDHGVIYDIIVQPLLWAGLLLNAFGLFAAPDSAILGAVAGYGVLFSIFWLYRTMRGRDGLGEGDFLLAAVIGAWLGLDALLPVFALAFVSGSIVGIGLMATRRHGMGSALPFGPFLAFGAWVDLMWHDQIVGLYIQTVFGR